MAADQVTLGTPPDADLADVERFGAQHQSLLTYGEHYCRAVATHYADALHMAKAGRLREAGFWLARAEMCRP